MTTAYFSWETFHFLRPLWFLALIPLVFLIWRMTKRSMNQRGWAGVIDEALLPYVLISKETRSQRWPKILTGIIGFLLVIALAGPVWEQLPQPVFRNDSALVIALDLSRSMDVADLKPSRLIRARFKIEDLLKQRKEGQTALLAYASDAYTVTPLTDDADTVLLQLKALTTDLMPQQGSRADRAMLKAAELLKQGGSSRGDILLITDGVQNERDSAVAAQIKRLGYRVLVLGIGTQEGAPIPDTQGGFFSDGSGNIILPKLEEGALKAVARSGGGSYQKYAIDDKDINRLMIQLDRQPEVSEVNEDGVSESKLTSDQWYEEGPWLLLLIIPFAAFSFRKGYLLILVFCLTGFSYSPESMAEDNITKNVWKRSDQIAEELFQKGDVEAAAKIFENKRWKGSAEYKAGDYESALESWEGFDDANGLYNKGNALAKMGQLEEALESYKKSLQLKPDFENAQYNFDQVKKALEEQQKEQQDQEGDQNKESEEKSDEDKKGDQSKQDDGSQNDEKKDQESSEENKQQSDTENNSAEQDGKKEPETESEKQQEQDDKREQQEKEMQQAEQSDSAVDEEQQAVEAALRAIPDDPGGLLRRKFKYQYQQQENGSEEEQQW